MADGTTNTRQQSKQDVEDGFLDKLREAPNDEDNRIVYADWLEEHGHARESEFLRVQTKLRKLRGAGEAGLADPSFEKLGVQLRELAIVIDQEWRRLVAEGPIELCEARFDFACPKRWDALMPTVDDHIRYCNACSKNVLYAKDLTEASAFARDGHCVVVDLVQLRRPHDLVRPLTPAELGPPVMMGGAMMPIMPVIAEPPPPPPPPEKPGVFGRLKSLFSR